MDASLTIVTPTLNAAAYLEQCLYSVRAQRIRGLQHLIIDGGSTDRTAEIAAQHSDVDWVAGPGWSQTRALNEGLRRATGDVVAWLNADDLYLDDALAFVDAHFRADPALDVLYGDCEVIGPAQEGLWWERPGPYDFQRMLRHGNYIAQPAVFLRRRLFAEIGYLDESLEYAMDYDFWLRARGRRIVYVPRPLARFRWHPQSKSARSQIAGWREFLRILHKHGGGWNPYLVWAYTRLLITLGRSRVAHSITGSRPMRPLTRGSA